MNDQHYIPYREIPYQQCFKAKPRFSREITQRRYTPQQQITATTITYAETIIPNELAEEDTSDYIITTEQCLLTFRRNPSI